MADEEVENDIDQEESKNFLFEFKEELVEEKSIIEETKNEIEDKTSLIEEDVTGIKGVNEEQKEVDDKNGKDEKRESIEKIVRSPDDDSRTNYLVSLEEKSITSTKMTENNDDIFEKEKDEEEKMKKDEEIENDVIEEDGKEEKGKRKLMQQVKKRTRQCGKQFREIIGKQEMKKEELEKREVNLRQRLDVLECSMPAVMVWNVWQRMAQGVPVPNLHRLMEKQFRIPGAAGEICCPNTPSQHYDCRIREIEAERKTAHRRLEDARVLWLEKETKLKERRDKLEEAKRIQGERKERIERLTKEAKELRETLKKMDEQAEEDMAGFCESGECGDVQCRERWLRGVNSMDSIKAIDVECLARLRQLAESELIMKKQIAELERREETYMKTLQHADEIWSKMEGDTADTLSALQEQLDGKANANQQLADRIFELENELENLRSSFDLCKSELTKYVSVEKIETIIGDEDDFAKTTDKMVGIWPKVAAKIVGREDDVAEVLDKEILIKDEQEDKETLARVDVEDREVSPDDIGEPTVPMEPEKIDAIHKYLAMLGSLEELYYDDDYGICGPKFECYEDDWQGIPTDDSTIYTGATPIISEKVIPADDIKEKPDDSIEEDDSLTWLIDKAIVESEHKHIPKDSKEIDEKFYDEKEKEEDDYEDDVIYEEIYEPEKIPDEIEKPLIDLDNVIIPLNKLRSWIDTVDSIRLVISKCSTCSNVKTNADNLAEEMATYAGVQAKEVIVEIIPKLDAIVEQVDQEELEKDVVRERRAIKEEVISEEPVYEIEDKIEIEQETEIFEDLIKLEPEEIPAAEEIFVDAETEEMLPAVLPSPMPLVKEEISEIIEFKEEMPTIDVAEVKIEKSVIAEVLPEEIQKAIEVELTKEPIPLDLDKVDIVLEKLQEKDEKDIEEEKEETEDETKIILPIQKLADDEEEEILIPDKEEIKLADDHEKVDIVPVILQEKEKKDIKEEIKETEDETKIILPIQKLADDEEEEILIPDKEEIKLTDDHEKVDIVPVKLQEKEKKDIEEEEIVKLPLKKITEESTDIPVKEPLIKYDKPLLITELEEIDKDMVLQEEIKEKEKTEDETKIILPIQKLSDEEEEILIPDKEEIKLADDLEKDIVEVEDEILEKLKYEKESEIAMIGEEKEKKLEREVKLRKEIKEETIEEKVDEVPLVKLEAEEIPTVEEIFVDAETKEELFAVLPSPTPLAKDISEIIEFKEEIPIEEDVEQIKILEKVPTVKEELEEMETKVLEEKPMEIEEVKEIKKEEIEEITDKLEAIEPTTVLVEKEKIKKKAKIPIDPGIVAAPYLIVADIEESFPDVSIPCVCKKPEEIREPPVISAMQIVITQTEIVQTVINRDTQTSSVHPMILKTTDQRPTEIGGYPEISEKTMRWRRRPKNKSTTPMSSAASQTDRPSLTLRSTMPNLNEKQRLLSNILRSLKSNLNTEEKEIRSINYGNKMNDGTRKCDCCVCGRNSIPPKILTTKVRSPSSLKPLKTKVPKMDQNTQDEEGSSYETLKSNIKDKLRTYVSYAPNVSKFGKQVCYEKVCTCSTPTGKSKFDTSSKNKYKSERKDQSCLAKISKRKTRTGERKKSEEIEKITCQRKFTECEEKITKKLKDQNDPYNCICTKLERTESGRLWKREICGCDEL